MQVAPAENSAFFAQFGWREADYRSTWDESRWLNRTEVLSRVWLVATQSGLQEQIGRGGVTE
jgi:hypothetical protein